MELSSGIAPISNLMTAQYDHSLDSRDARIVQFKLQKRLCTIPKEVHESLGKGNKVLMKASFESAPHLSNEVR